MLKNEVYAQSTKNSGGPTVSEGRQLYPNENHLYFIDSRLVW